MLIHFPNHALVLRLASLALFLAMIFVPPLLRAEQNANLEQLVTREILSISPADGAGGFAVGIRINGRNLFLNYGYADLANGRAIDSDALFNVASIEKVFDATLLAQAINQGELQFDDPVAEFVTELQQGSDIRRVTIGQLATHTSGLLLPQDHPPWPEEHYTLPQFIRTLNQWKADPAHQPGKQRIYTHAGFILLHLAFERRFDTSYSELMHDRILRPLGLVSTKVPSSKDNPRGSLDPALKNRAVQSYNEDGARVGELGHVQGYYLWPGTAQMFSSSRDMATFIAANLGELPHESSLQDAMQFAQQGFFTIGPHHKQALAWEILERDGLTIVEKVGGLSISSVYLGMIRKAKVGVVILCNRGNRQTDETGRRILLGLAQQGD